MSDGILRDVVQEPSLFAVAKLLETGLVNLSRFDVLWQPVTSHLLEVREVMFLLADLLSFHMC